MTGAGGRWQGAGAEVPAGSGGSGPRPRDLVRCACPEPCARLKFGRSTVLTLPIQCDAHDRAVVASQCRSQTECGADEHAPSRPRRHRMGCRPPPHQKAVRSLTMTHDRRVRLCACAAARAVHRAATEATGDRTTSVRVTSIRATVSPELCRRRDLRNLGCHRPSQASRVVGGASPYRPSEEPARAAVPPSRCPSMSSRVSCESEGARVRRCRAVCAY